MAQRVSVMYAGVVVENADVFALFSNPLHPYTIGLLTSIPRMDHKTVKTARLNTIKGIVPNLLHLPEGCRFFDRCPNVKAQCMEREPPLAPHPDKSAKNHMVRCWLY